MTTARTMTGGQLAEHIGIGHQRLDRWVRAEYLEPKDPHPGTGQPREFDEHEIERARWMAILVRDIGLDPAVASRAAGNIADGQPAQIGRITLTPSLSIATAAAFAAVVRDHRYDERPAFLDGVLEHFLGQVPGPRAREAVTSLAARCLEFLEDTAAAEQEAAR